VFQFVFFLSFVCMYVCESIVILCISDVLARCMKVISSVILTIDSIL